MDYNFDWDPNKARSNQNKHGVNFEEAATVFRDHMALSIYDQDHSYVEDRWITLGISSKGRLLVVCHTFRKEIKESATIRIFSSRKTTKQESKQYGE